MNISANGTLTGIRAISNNVTLANGATLAPGVSGVGTQTVNGTLVLGSTTALDFGLGLPGESQSFVSVNGNLTLNGTLNISNVGGFGVGTYTLFAYTGTLTTNGSPSILTIGTTPNGSLTYKIDIRPAGEVNLDVTSPTGEFVRYMAVAVFRQHELREVRPMRITMAPASAIPTSSWRASTRRIQRYYYTSSPSPRQ